MPEVFIKVDEELLKEFKKLKKKPEFRGMDITEMSKHVKIVPKEESEFEKLLKELRKKVGIK